MTQRVKEEDPSSIPSTQVKTWSWLVAHTSNPSTERAKAGSSSGNAGQRASQIPGGDRMVPWECRSRLTSDLHMYMPTHACPLRDTCTHGHTLTSTPIPHHRHWHILLAFLPYPPATSTLSMAELMSQTTVP